MSKRRCVVTRWIKGMTMVEILVATAIIAIAAMMLAGGVHSAMNLIRRGSDLERAVDEAYGQLEYNAMQHSIDRDDTVQFNIQGGAIYTVKGVFVTGSDIDHMGVTFTSFESHGTQ